MKRKRVINIAKILNDKYYTSPELAEYCVKKTEEIIGKENITEYLEPSAGSGVFLDYLDKPYFAYDIEPEDDRIVKQDYLSLELDYKKGRCVIGNPPFGEKNILSMKFFKHSLKFSDYIAFILPISQLNNNQQMFEFDLIHSEDLGKKLYSNIEIHCCLNIFKRPEILHTKPFRYKFEDITFKECRKSRNQFLPKDFNYDIGFCSWGSILKEVEYEGQFQQEIYMKINNLKLKNKILEIMRKTDWLNIYAMTKCPHIHQWQISKYIKEQIPEIE